MPNKKHSVASNIKPQRHEATVNNTEGAHMPNTKATGKVTEKEAQVAFSSDRKTSTEKHK